MHRDARSPIRTCLVKVHRTGARHCRARERTPSNHLVLDLVDDLGIPLHARAGGCFRHPVRSLGARHTYRLEVLHEAREILEVTPEAIELLERPTDCDGILHVYAAATPQGDA